MKKLILSFILIFSSTTLNAEIVEIDTMADLTNYVEQDTLLIFDLDNTLIAPNQMLGSDQWFEYMVEKYETQGIKRVDAILKTREDWIKIQRKTGIKAVEAIIPKTVAKIQLSGVKTMGLTARPVQLAETSLKQLGLIGVELRRNPVTNTKELNPKNGDYNFKYGIIFLGDNHSKGEVLLQFFKSQKLNPKKVVFVDDKDKNVRSVEGALAKNNIPFIGLRYSAADKDVKNFNKDIAEVQWDVFNKLLSDEKAKALLVN